MTEQKPSPIKTIITADGKVINVFETASLSAEEVKRIVNDFKELGIVFGVHEYKRLYNLEEMREAYDAGVFTANMDSVVYDEDFDGLIKELN